jgi:putative MATE family efflux protein
MKSDNVVNQSLWRITWPLLVEFMLIMPGPALDAYFLSKVSDTAAAAVSAVSPYFMISILIIQSLNQGGMSVAAQRLGANDTRNVNATFLTMMMIDVIVCLVLGLLFLLTHNQMAGLLGLTGELQKFGGRFLLITGGLILFLGIRLTYASMTAVHGKTIYNLISAAIMVAVNILLNIVFVNGLFGVPKLGVTGVAFATVTGWIASVLFNIYIVHYVLKISFPWRGIGARLKALARPILGIGLPSMIEPVSFHSLQAIVTAIVVMLGETELISRAYLFNVLVFAFVIPLALSIGTQIKVGHLIGAKRFDDADRQMRSSTKQGVITAGVLVIFFYLFSDHVLGLFTSNREVLALGHKVLLVAIVLEMARPVNLIVGSCLRASGDAKYISFMGASVMFLWSVPVIYLLAIPLKLGLIGVWLGMASDEMIRSVVNFRRWLKGRWRESGVAIQPHQEDSFAEKMS